MELFRVTPPNLISLARLLVTPVLFLLVLRPGPGSQLLAFALGIPFYLRRRLAES